MFKPCIVKATLERTMASANPQRYQTTNNLVTTKNVDTTALVSSPCSIVAMLKIQQ